MATARAASRRGNEVVTVKLDGGPVGHHLRPLLAILVVACLVAGCGATAIPPTIPAIPSAAASTPAPSTASRLPVVVDLDLDSSDIAALAVLLRDEALDIRAILLDGTGLVHCAPGLRNTSYLLGQFGITGIPIACGREDAGPDGRPFPADWRVGPDTAWGIDIAPQISTGIPPEAATLLARVLTESEEPLTIVALGPWTNLEDALAADPGLAARIKAIHAMAGTVDTPGNVIIDDVTADDRLEWNVAADPSSVAAVMATRIPIAIVPLDATDDVPVPPDLVDRLATDHVAAGADLTYELLVREPGRTTDPGQQLWDELAALTVSQPDLVTWQDAALAISPDGRLDRSATGRPVRFATAADRPTTEAALLAALRKGPPRHDPFSLAGTIAVAWDGTSCTMQVSSPRAGVHLVSLANSSRTPGGTLIMGVEAPHRWSELMALFEDIDIEHVQQPDWMLQGGQIADETGAGTAATATATIKAEAYGPICVTGTWPDVTFTVGLPVTFGG
jgi:inosine-uridine nucleoside N-ribohydrolase